MRTHTPSNGQRWASYKEAREGSDRKTDTAPRLCDGKGALLSKAASNSSDYITLAPNLDSLENGKTEDEKT